MSTTFKIRLTAVQNRIITACERCGRNPDEITLVAVSKTFPFARIEDAAGAGQVHFGENYIQDCVNKMAQARDRNLPLQWHFIGHLQSNKVKFYNNGFHLFHGLDSVKLARGLARKAVAGKFKARVLVQVNIGDEATKAGIPAASLFDFLSEIGYIEGLSIEGLMAIPPAGASAEASRPYFRSLFKLFTEAQAEFIPVFPEFKQLSMGMSKDFEVAVEEGATIVRVGSLLFGEREKKVVVN